MKLFTTLALLISFSAMATCPTSEHSRKNGWRLYEEDQERELWHCKMTKSDTFKQLEFCVGRMTSSMTSEYIGLAGIEQWNREYVSDGVYAMKRMWIGLDHDEEGEAIDTRNELSVDYKPTTDIMANNSYRYIMKLDKKTGRGSYVIQKKKYPCIFCGGWKTDATTELKCTLKK